MYWKVESYTDDDDNTWCIYNYIDFVERNCAFKPWYNGILKEWKYPILKEMVIKAQMADSEEAFEAWWISYKSNQE